MRNSNQKQALLAGVSLLVMAITAGFSYGYVHGNLLTEAPNSTFLNLSSNTTLFLFGIFGWVIIFLTDLTVAIALLKFFRATSPKVSIATAMERITYTIILGLGILQLFRILPLLSIENNLTDPTNAEKAFALIQLFTKLWSIGLIIFGVHLIGLGYLSVKSVVTPSILGYLLYLAGLGYTLTNGARQLNFIPTLTVDKVEKILSFPMALAEIALAFWLIYFGLRKYKHEPES